MNITAPIARGPLVDLHHASRARIVAVDGCEFAAEFDGAASELSRARTSVGIADLSHLTKLQIVGPNLESLCKQFLPADQSGQGERLHLRRAWVVEHAHPSPLSTQPSILCAWLAEDHLVAISLGLQPSDFAPLQVFTPTHSPLTTHHSVRNTTGHFAAFDLVGPFLEKLLRQLTSMDISARAFTPGHCAQTGVARIPVILIRPPSSTLPRLQLWCAREYGQYIWETLLETARPLGGGPLGWEAWRATF